METNGKGVFAFSNGSKYDGEWKLIDGTRKRHGKGKMQDGSELYDGEWENDLMHGNGSINFCSGDKYIGQFANGDFNGNGKYTFNDGAAYEGGWRNGKMHGEGVYVDKEAVVWKGQFHHGKYNSAKKFLSLR